MRYSLDNFHILIVWATHILMTTTNLVQVPERMLASGINHIH
jgi:hypothetical protein